MTRPKFNLINNANGFFTRVYKDLRSEKSKLLIMWEDPKVPIHIFQGKGILTRGNIQELGVQ